MINHINLPDASGQIYCCLRNRVIQYDQDHQVKYCSNCKMYNGSAGGSGVECLWDDERATDAALLVTEPMLEWMSNQKKRVKTIMSAWDDRKNGIYIEDCPHAHVGEAGLDYGHYGEPDQL